MEASEQQWVKKGVTLSAPEISPSAHAANRFASSEATSNIDDEKVAASNMSVSPRIHNHREGSLRSLPASVERVSSRKYPTSIQLGGYEKESNYQTFGGSTKPHSLSTPLVTMPMDVSSSANPGIPPPPYTKKDPGTPQLLESTVDSNHFDSAVDTNMFGEDDDVSYKGTPVDFSYMGSGVDYSYVGVPVDPTLCHDAKVFGTSRYKTTMKKPKSMSGKSEKAKYSASEPVSLKPLKADGSKSLKELKSVTTDPTIALLSQPEEVSKPNPLLDKLYKAHRKSAPREPGGSTSVNTSQVEAEPTFMQEEIKGVFTSPPSQGLEHTITVGKPSLAEKVRSV